MHDEEDVYPEAEAILDFAAWLFDNGYAIVSPIGVALDLEDVDDLIMDFEDEA